MRSPTHWVVPHRTMKTVSTSQGEVAVLDSPVELLRTIRAFLPFGAVHYLPPPRGADFGLVMPCGDRALLAGKRQPVDCDEKMGRLMYLANETLIAHTLASYLRHQFDGLFLPCAYLRQKQGGRVESGIACFGFPAPQGRECQEPPSGFAFDQHLGRGFTTDPAWTELRATGVARVFHVPSVPAAIREDQLPIAKAEERNEA